MAKPSITTPLEPTKRADVAREAGGVDDDDETEAEAPSSPSRVESTPPAVSPPPPVISEEEARLEAESIARLLLLGVAAYRVRRRGANPDEAIRDADDRARRLASQLGIRLRTWMPRALPVVGTLAMFTTELWAVDFVRDGKPAAVTP